MNQDWACEYEGKIYDKSCDHSKNQAMKEKGAESVLVPIGGDRPCDPKHDQFMKSNAIPLRKEWAKFDGGQVDEHLLTAKYDGEVFISTHSGFEIRRRLNRWQWREKKKVCQENELIESGKGYKKETYFYETYIKPLLINPQKLKLIIFGSCNSGTRWSPIWKNSRGTSLVDRILEMVDKDIRKDPSLNGGHLPEIWGANGFMWSGFSGGAHSVMRVHKKYCPGGECKPPDHEYGTISPHTWMDVYSEFKRKANKIGEKMFLQAELRYAKAFPDTKENCELQGKTGDQIGHEDGVPADFS